MTSPLMWMLSRHLRARQQHIPVRDRTEAGKLVSVHCILTASVPTNVSTAASKTLRPQQFG